MKEEGGEKNREANEEVLLEVETATVLQILVVEVKIKTPINQVVKELKNQIFSAITIKSMDSIDMSAGRDNIIRTCKVKISHAAQTIPLVNLNFDVNFCVSCNPTYL